MNVEAQATATAIDSVAETSIDALLPVDTRARTESLTRRLLTSPTAVICSVILVVIALAGVFASLLAPYGVSKLDMANMLASPGGKHFLGTDSAGRDVYTRLLYATRTSIVAALLCAGIAVALGVITGLLSGYFGGKADTFAQSVANLVMALPGIVVMLAAAAVLGHSIWLAMSIFGVLMAPGFFRLVNVTVKGVRNELYVDAARVSGLRDRRIMRRHILSVVRAPIIIQVGIVISIAIAIQAGLSLLGLGDMNTPTWGGMLFDGYKVLFRQPWVILWPAVLIGITCLCLALLANAIRDELERSGPKVGRAAKAAAMRDIPLPKTVETIIHPIPLRADAPLLEVKSLEIGYPDGKGGYLSVVHDVSLTVHRGEVVGLIGESGSGKTQTAFAVMGLLPSVGRVRAGSVMFDGKELAGANEKAYRGIIGKRISYVPQEPMSNLDPSFTVGKQLVEPMTICLGISKAEAKAKALALLERVGIPDPQRTFDSYPHQISGGMAQRVLIAGAVSCEPDLIIADEPTTALDVTVQAEVLDLLRTLQKETNTALLLVTHNFGVVADLCDRVAVMQYGRIVESGTVRDIFHEAQHPYTKSLLAAILDDAPPRSDYSAPTTASKLAQVGS